MDSVTVPTFGGNSMESVHGIRNSCPQESTEFHAGCPRNSMECVLIANSIATMLIRILNQ